MIIGLIGAPNKGKSTFFSAATQIDIEIADYPFTTIKPNKGVTYAKTKDPSIELNVTPDPHNSKVQNGIRFIPINIIDVAGLVPDAHKGKGMGNQFLSDLAQADCLIQVIDISGKTDLEGNVKNIDPADEIMFLETEIDHWIAGIITRNWNSIRNRNIIDLAEFLQGLKIKPEHCKKVAIELELKPERINWTEQQIFDFAKKVRQLSKPIVIAANKIDLSNGMENLTNLKNKFPTKTIIGTSALIELTLRKASTKGIINYMPGDIDFNIIGETTPKQKEGLIKLKSLLKQLPKSNGTGVQQLIDHVTFNVLQMIAVFPVEDETKYCNNLGKVLPDVILMKTGATPFDLAGKIHTDIQKHYITATDAKKKIKIGKQHQLQHGDIIKIFSGN